MPYTKMIVTTALLLNYSFANNDIINPFEDPSIILSPQMDSTQEEVSSSLNNNTSIDDDSVINPFSDPSVIINSQENVIEENVIEDSLSTSSESVVDESPTYSNSTPAINNTEFRNTTPTYQRAKNQEVLDAKALPQSPDELQSYNTIAPDIQGKYRLVKGTNLNVNKRIEDGYLVIEKLDENNFGYYYTFTLEKVTPATLFGIYNYDKGQFNQRVIKEEGSFKTENLTNTKIVTDGSKLELEVNIEGGSINILWEQDYQGAVPFELQKSLKEAKQNYKEIYKNRFSKLTY